MNSVYKELFHASLDAIVCSNETGRITLWNHAAEKMFGYSAEEAVGQPLTMLMSADDGCRHQAGFERFI
ncbi:MAG: PAS domain S-box protein, partial [Ghiorsea sp.]|nr:PAS domain S-box protein [Ghiorsea sp.]